MSKTTAIGIVVGFILLLGGGLAYWYYTISPHNGGGTETPDPTNNNGNIFPFGNTGGNGGGNTTGATTTGATNGSTSAPQVRKISSSPTASFSPLNDRVNGASVRYIEVETGNVYEAPLSVTQTRRISNTTIPKVRSALWLPLSKAFIAQYLAGDDETIQSFYGDVNPPVSEGAEGNVSGKFLEDGITSLISLTPLSASTTAKNPGRIFYLKNTSTGSEGYTALQNGSGAKRVFSSPLSEWLLLNNGGSTIFLQTKSSALASSYLFSLNTVSGALSKVLGNIVGLSSLPNAKGDTILYSETVSKTPLLHLYTLKNNTFSPIPLNTFAEKCAWLESTTTASTSGVRIYCAVPTLILNQQLYPDSWYQGKTTFNDDIWEINPITLETKKVAPLVDNGFYIDVWNPQVSTDGRYLLFTNKRDMTLWSVRVVE